MRHKKQKGAAGKKTLLLIGKLTISLTILAIVFLPTIFVVGAHDAFIFQSFLAKFIVHLIEMIVFGAIQLLCLFFGCLSIIGILCWQPFHKNEIYKGP